jgi:hypothetical protein
MATKKTKKKSAKKGGAARSAAKAPKKTAKRGAAKKTAARRPAARKRASGPAHRVVHWEIQSKVPEKLHAFYGDVFTWKIDANNPMNYGMVTSGDGKASINGGIGGAMGPAPQVLVYIDVPDINAALDRINASGGRTIMPRTDIGPVIMGVFQDPEGNTLGLIEG